VVSTADGRIGLLDLRDAATVTITPRADHAGKPLDVVALKGARLQAVAASPLPGLEAPVRTLGAIARSIGVVGALEFALEQSVQCAIDRVQFGRPIGKIQAIQQPLAVLAGDMAAARMAARVAAQDAPWAGNPDAPSAVFSAAVAKIRRRRGRHARDLDRPPDPWRDRLHAGACPALRHPAPVGLARGAWLGCMVGAAAGAGGDRSAVRRVLDVADGSAV
jgi:hypothetical protein